MEKTNENYTLDDYQRDALVTAIYSPDLKVIYPALGLAGETGECCDKIKKVYRDKGGKFDDATREEIMKEIGDVLWYCATLAHDLGYSLSDVARANKDKLLSRMERGKIHGNGDNR